MPGGSAPQSTPTIVTPQIPAAGHGWANQTYPWLNQFMGMQFPEYQGQVDPGLSPTMQALMRQAQGYSQSPTPGVMGQATSGLGAFMGGGGSPFGGQAGRSLASFFNPFGGGGGGSPYGDFRGPAPDYGFGASPLGPGMGGPPGWSPTGAPPPSSAVYDRSAMGAYAGQSQGGPQPPGGDFPQPPPGGWGQLSPESGGPAPPGGFHTSMRWLTPGPPPQGGGMPKSPRQPGQGHQPAPFGLMDRGQVPGGGLPSPWDGRSALKAGQGGGQPPPGGLDPSTLRAISSVLGAPGGGPPGGGLGQLVSPGGPSSVSSPVITVDRPNQGGTGGDIAQGPGPQDNYDKGGNNPGGLGLDRFPPPGAPPGGPWQPTQGLSFLPSFVGWDPGNPAPWMTGPSSASLGGPDWAKSVTAPQSISSPTPQPGSPPGDVSSISSPFPQPPPGPSSISAGSGPPPGGLGQINQQIPVPPGGAGTPAPQVPGQVGGAPSPPAPPGPASPFGPTGAYDVLRASIPAMNETIDTATERAVSAAGATGNRYSSAAFDAAGEAARRAGLDLTRDFSERLFGQTQSDLDRQLQASLGGMGFEQQGLDRQLRAILSGPGFAQTQDQLDRNRLQLPFQMGQYEQGRQDQYGQLGLSDFRQNQLGWLPSILQGLSTAGGGGLPAQVGANQTGGSPGSLDYISAIAPIIAAFAFASDERLKTDIEMAPAPPSYTGEVSRWKPATFRWRGSGEPDFGFVAQQVGSVSPAVVKTLPGGVQGISVPGVLGYLAGSTRELDGRVRRLEGG